MALMSDACLFNWDHLDLYIFPPMAILHKVINKLLLAQGMSPILITLFWLRHEWFPDLLKLLVDTP